MSIQTTQEIVDDDDGYPVVVYKVVIDGLIAGKARVTANGDTLAAITQAEEIAMRRAVRRVQHWQEACATWVTSVGPIP